MGSDGAEEPAGDAQQTADQLMCEHRWVPPSADGEHPRCATCGLGYEAYVHGSVRAALSRMGAWDD